jgi:hypothetical protein
MGQILTVTDTQGDTYTHENPEQYKSVDGWLTVQERGAVGSVFHHYNEANIFRYTVKQTPED